MKRTRFFNKFAGLVLTFTMILLAIPTMQAKADETTIKVHFKNTENWSSVYAYSWDSTGTLLGAWPGTDITSTVEGDYYTAILEDYSDGSSLNIIFGDGGSVQTADLSCDLTKGLEWWVVPSDNSTGKWACTVADSKKDAEAGKSDVTTPDEPATPENPTVTVSPVVDGSKVVFYYESATAAKVEVFGSMNNWESGFEMTKDDNVFSYTCELDAGTYQYKFVVNGSEWIVDPVNPNTVEDGLGGSNSSFEVTAASTTPQPQPSESEEPNTEVKDTEVPDVEAKDTEVKDTEIEDTENDSTTDASANTAPMSGGMIILISAIVTIVVVLGGFAAYMYFVKKKQA